VCSLLLSARVGAIAVGARVSIAVAVSGALTQISDAIPGPHAHRELRRDALAPSSLFLQLRKAT